MCMWCVKIIFAVLYCRGIQFRREFSHISEIHALTPASTNVMALTATATSAIMKKNRVPRDGHLQGSSKCSQ